MAQDGEFEGGSGGIPAGSQGSLPPIPKLSFEDRLTLLKWQKEPTVFGRIWNAPNTLLGLAYGTVGYGVGKLTGWDPGISVRNGAVQFTNNPFGGVSAITLGDTTTWNGDPFVNRPNPKYPERSYFDENEYPLLENKIAHTFPEHEVQHHPQGHVLGPLYLPSNLLGGLYAMIRDRDWHGPSNWNERGPMSDPPRPWAGRQKP